jgi:hypothetical protein
MIFSLFQKKKNEYIEKEMENLLEKEDDEADEADEVEDNKLMKTLTYLQNLINI